MESSSCPFSALKYSLLDPERFSRLVVSKLPRPYQLEAARAIVDAIFYRRGRTFAIMMSRQAGKNELSGQLEAYLLNLYRLPPAASASTSKRSSSRRQAQPSGASASISGVSSPSSTRRLTF